MKALVVYDTVSPMKLTAKVAETIGEALKEKGNVVDTFYVKEVNKATIKDYDCLIVGSPTMQWKPTSGMMQFLDSLPINEFSGKSGAAFDTQVKMVISGNATKGLESKLAQLGLTTISPPLIAYVEGKQNKMNLKAGELEKTKAWAHELAKTLQKGT
jgi:flavorubredoxin